MAENNIAMGVFVGLDSSSLEYIASIIAPYQQRFTPRVADFMLIDNGEEYLIARVMDYVPQGELTSFMGEKWLSEVALNPEAIGVDLKRKKVFYRVKVKLLGRMNKETKKYTPGINQIPHITSQVLFPSSEYIKIITSQALQEQTQGIEIGSYWLDENIPINFDVGQLPGKRSFIFARAGYGKSNLMKLLAANWKQDYGSIFIFDPEGEYSITDKKGRPGIMDQVPAILVTNREKVKQDLNGINVYDKLKFNLKDFKPAFIVPILVNEEKQNMVFFSKLMSLKKEKWEKLVDMIYEEEWGVDPAEIKGIVQRKDDGKKEDITIQAIINNLVGPIRKLHDPNSELLPVLEKASLQGHPVILDISLLDSHTALQFSSIIVSHFFGQNQYKFTGGREDLYKIVFVIEEAQSVIGVRSGVSKFIELAKEGRKYQLGGIFITQQPASIAPEILSQGDNFFTFHLLSKDDLKSLQKANAHYSLDVLTQLLNEPIPGKAYIWTSRQPFVLPVRIKNFETEVKPNRALEVQSQKKILETMLSDIPKKTEVKQSILQKLESICRELDISVADDSRFNIEIGRISKTLFSSLNANERKFLEQENALKGDQDGKFYGIYYPYLTKLWTALNDSQNQKNGK